MTDGTEHPDAATTPAPSAAGPIRPTVPGQARPEQERPAQAWPGGAARSPAGRPVGSPPPPHDPPSAPSGPGRSRPVESPPLPSPPPAEPDWAALAERNAADLRRRRRLRAGGIAAGLCLLAAGAGLLGARQGGPGPGDGTGGPGGTGAHGPTTELPALLADHSGRRTVVLAPAAHVQEVPGGHVLRLVGGPESFARAADQPVDVGRSFTVSAWVYSDAPTGSRAVVSQGDGPAYSFELGRTDVGGRPAWSFRVRTAEPVPGAAEEGATAQVVAEGAGTVGVWALLTATYDVGPHTVALYLDGRPVASAPVPGIWPAPGPLQLGRSRQHDGWGGPWSGAIGRIVLWDQALDPGQVAALSGAAGTLTARPTASWLVD
ncbi:LamG domain-containing protein [Kitasatospora sp. NBC_00240]|uniref:LamG domain-containing protein n=1 Tax=Kitasatospora sp. NBC_00240 TaxID=2903567 RepID=UPI00225641EC|nr:LamG domain-containing protein [Kitasatospora sp. NBC_00240]MCX5212070.1 LamG domain-containing protein [Kitasatospora sp. NBC_00240]